MTPAARTGDELRLLAGLLRMPGQESLLVMEELVSVHPWLSDAIHEIAALPLDRWQAEYTQLFINGHPNTPCPPFESAYRHGQMSGTASRELERLYAKIGLESGDIPPDFLGVMLECAAYLGEHENTVNEKLQTELWRDHLERWVPGFSRDLIENSRLLLYREIGRRLARMFCKAV